MVEILTIGNELLAGVIVDTNAAWIMGRLFERGVLAERKVTVADDVEAIADALREAAGRSRIVVCSGGLGPTEDDLTAEGAARAAGVSLALHPEASAQVEAAVARRGMKVTERQLRQARLPEGARVLENHEGTAPGFAVEIGECTAFFFPGPPREMRPMVEAHVLPAVDAALSGGERWASCTVRTFGLPESRLADRIAESGVDLEGVELGYRLAFPEIHLRLRAHASTDDAARARVDGAAAALEDALGEVAFARDETTLPMRLGERLVECGKTLALAESCTGGLAGSLVTDVPGSSRYLLLSAVTYANEMKEKVLGVPHETIAGPGAVSEQTARAMAEGVLALSGADLAVSITGVAGPGGGSEAKPVGTVWFAIAERGGETTAHHRLYPSTRDRVRRLAAFYALDLVRRRLDGDAR